MSQHTAIVAHDAGAAYHIIAWLQTGLLDPATSRLCFSGPAAAAYQKVDAKVTYYSLDEALDQAGRLISGTGWSSDIEHRARQQAASQAIPSIAVIDHWVNYRERFIRGGQEQLPDTLWVTDHYAASRAREVFPERVVEQQNNAFLQQQLGEIAQWQGTVPATSESLLFVMEPIRNQWGEQEGKNGEEEPGELQALAYFLANQQRVLADNSPHLIIRPHPSDPPGKYQQWLAKNPAANIEVNESASLAELIAGASIVVGCETYAMIVALAAGKKVISALPPWAPPCVLPHREILHLKSLCQTSTLPS